MTIQEALATNEKICLPDWDKDTYLYQGAGNRLMLHRKNWGNTGWAPTSYHIMRGDWQIWKP